jgi:hypothetical protein
MKVHHALTCLFLGGILVLSSGCQSTLTTAYAPCYKPDYSKVARIRVALQPVTDQRSDKPNVYYLNSKNGDTGEFDRPAADIVREAVETELERAGQTLCESSSSAAVLSCELLELRASIAEPILQSPTLDLSVAIRFEWRDPKSGAVLRSNERSERRSRKLSMGGVPRLAGFDQTVVRDYGNEMINDLLPRVIEKELCSVSLLQQTGK